MSRTCSTVTDGPVFTTEAYAAVEKAANSRRSLYVPSVLEHAAELLTDMWATGEKHGVTPSDWDWTGDMAGSTLDVVSRQYDSAPKPERTIAQIASLHRYLIAALTSGKLGLTARLDDSGVIVKRGPDTPRGGRHGDADVDVRIYSDGGWGFSFAVDGASVMPIVAPASQAGAHQVAEVIRAFICGEMRSRP
jgi:hypothetical protein